MVSKVALCISPSLDEAILPEWLMSAGVDVSHMVFDSLGIAEVRDLTKRANQKAMLDQVRGFVIFTNGMTVEAQNALLKLFEEPPENCVIFLVVPHESLLISTLRSRIFEVHKSVSDDKEDEGENFLQSNYAERLALIAEKSKQKDGRWFESMTTSLVQACSHTSQNPDILRALELVERYVRIRGASRKMLLEELALSLPISK